MLGTSRLRAPSLPATSTAMPRLICLPDHAEGFAIPLGVGVVQVRELLQRLNDAPADQVRVGHLALADQGPVLVDDAAVFVHHLDGDGALRRGERNRACWRPCSRAIRAAAPLQGHELARGRRGRRSGRRRSAGRHRGGRSRGRRTFGLAVLENLFPAFVHRTSIVQVLLIQLFFEPAIDAGLRVGFGCHGRKIFLYP